MRFLVDECTGPAVARWLREKGHDVFSVYEQARGLADDEIIQKALMDNRLVITNDKDFGEKIFRERRPYRGVILLRLKDERTPNKIAALQGLLTNYADRLADRFTVVTEKKIRISGR